MLWIRSLQGTIDSDPEGLTLSSLAQQEKGYRRTLQLYFKIIYQIKESSDLSSSVLDDPYSVSSS